MQTGTRRLAAAGMIVAALTAGCDGAPAPSPPPPPLTAADLEWREVGSWAGRLNRQTESFEVSMAAMRLRWRTFNETRPGAGRLLVTLHSAVSGRPLQTILDRQGPGHDAVDVAEEPRWCHFSIEATDVEYELTLEQGFLRPGR